VKQLGNRLAKEEDSHAKELVAINISKIVNPGTVLPSSVSEGNAIAGLKFAADKFCYEHIKFLGGEISPKIFGTAVCIRMPWVVAGKFQNTYMPTLIPFNQGTEANKKLFAALRGCMERLHGKKQ